MTTESGHHTSGGLGVAATLAATAGFVDAFLFTRVTPVFVANMSGNLVRLGIATGNHDGRGVAAPTVALAGFVGGAMLAMSLIDLHVRRDRAPTGAPLLALEAVLLVLLPIVMTAADIAFSSSIQPIDYLVVVIGSTAMGMQAVALRRVGQVAVSTTYGTGAVVRLGEKLALGLRRAARPDELRRRVTIAILGIVLVSYVAGAAFATLLGDSPWLLLIPASVPACAAVGSSRRGAEPGMDDDDRATRTFDDG